MSKTEIKILEDKRRELTITIDRPVFDEAVTKAFRKNAPKISVPGFRKGKATRGIIEKFYGKGVFYNDALEDILPGIYEEAVKEAGLEVVGRPQFDIDEIGEEGITVKACVYVKPEVTVGEYKGLKVDRIYDVVSEELVDADIERIRKRNAREIEVTDRPAALGDIAVIDYDGSIDGVHFDGGKDEGHHLKLGSGSFIPGFEDQIVGHNVGDSFDVNVTFPEEYGAKDLAGKAAVFACTLHKIEIEEIPELDDEFVKDVSEFDTVAEYRADVRARLEKTASDAADNGAERRLVDALVDITEVDIPQPMIDEEVENIIRDRDYSLRSQGLSLDDYMKYTGMTLEKLREQTVPTAERQVKTRLALEKIVELEKIEATEEDTEAEFQKLSEAYGMDVETIKKSLTPETVNKDIVLRKAIDFVKASAVITSKPYEEPKETPAKKAAAKKAAAKKAEKAEGEEEEAPKKTTRRKKADADTAEETAEDAPAEKPKKTRKTAAKKEEGTDENN